ncbi:MAG TPA: hypothetical protein VI895_01780 [Bdellovibrionota bacterium]|nr:hypothetical protein [Bdellovibrionota bacterium]
MGTQLSLVRRQHSHAHSSENGTALVILMIIIVVAALVGIWGLSSSRQGILKAGLYRASVATQYGAETGIQKTIQRVQEIVDPGLTDSLKSLYSPGQEKDINFLVRSMCIPEDPGSTCDTGGKPACTCNSGGYPACCGSSSTWDPPCPSSFDPSSDLDAILSSKNVICNFMGSALPNTQVVLVRRSDFVSGTGRAGMLLVNAISTDAGGRRKIVQGVIVVPYQPDPANSGYFLPIDTEKPYLATSLKGSGG